MANSQSLVRTYAAALARLYFSTHLQKYLVMDKNVVDASWLSSTDRWATHLEYYGWSNSVSCLSAGYSNTAPARPGKTKTSATTTLLEITLYAVSYAPSHSRYLQTTF